MIWQTKFNDLATSPCQSNPQHANIIPTRTEQSFSPHLRSNNPFRHHLLSQKLCDDVTCLPRRCPDIFPRYFCVTLIVYREEVPAKACEGHHWHRVA